MRARLIRQAFPDRPALGTAVSHAILLRVAAGELPPTVRLHRPGRILAFGRMDRLAAGYPRAIRAARTAGFEPVERLAGGRAAVYHEGTLALSQAVPDERPTARTGARFEALAGALAEALRSLGVDARVGEVPGEYCPGAWSVNAGGRTKLAGIGQRIVRGGAHLGAVIVVSGADRVRDVLLPVYEALGLDWDPATAGAVEAEVEGRADLIEAVEGAILDRLGADRELEEARLDAATLKLARRLEERHTPNHG